MRVEKELELNLSTENIMKSLNKKIEADNNKKYKRKRTITKITSIAVAAVICLTSVKLVDILTNNKENTINNENVENIIESHMFPLTITKIPKSKEAFIVSLADKICAVKENLNFNVYKVKKQKK